MDKLQSFYKFLTHFPVSNVTLEAMKLLRGIISTVCIVTASLATAGEDPITESNGDGNQPTDAKLPLLRGTWEGFMVGAEADRKITVTITGNSLHFHRDTNFWFETTFTLPAGTEPNQLRATIKDCADKQSIGEVVPAIYKIEDGTLTLIPIGGGDEAAPKSIEEAKEKGLTRYEFRSVQPQDKKIQPPTIK